MVLSQIYLYDIYICEVVRKHRSGAQDLQISIRLGAGAGVIVIIKLRGGQDEGI